MLGQYFNRHILAGTILLFFAIFMAAPCVHAAESLKNRDTPQEPVVAKPQAPVIAMPQAPAITPEASGLKERIFITLPGGQRLVITDILDNGDMVTEEGIVVTPEGALENGEFAGQKIAIASEEVKAGVASPNPPAAPVLAKASPPDKAEPPKEKSEKESIEDLLAFAGGPETKAEKPAKSAKSPKTAPAKVEKAEAKPQKAKSEKARPPKPKPSQALYIPENASASRQVDFLEGCWKGGSVDYHTKRKLGTCFCFKKGGRSGQETVIDPAKTGITRGAARASMGRGGALIIDSEPRRTASGIPVWAAQRMICRNKGQKAYCMEDFHDGRTQAFETSFQRTPACP